MLFDVASIWLHRPFDLVARIERRIDAARDRLQAQKAAHIFFRADDVGVPGKQFDRLLSIFARHKVPLSLAVVPARLTALRWQSLRGLCRNTAQLWCWHQHGWRHINHARQGKKQEFGCGRHPSEIRNDLIRGKRRLEDLMDQAFYPVFTPPWNRCCLTTLHLLHELGYAAVSRKRDSLPLSPEGLPDLCVDVDLHTRRETNPQTGWRNLFKELEQGISAGRCGIMIHHQKMNDAAFDFLDMLVKVLAKGKGLQLVNFKDLAEVKGQQFSHQARRHKEEI